MNAGKPKTYLCSTTMPYIDDENSTNDALGKINAIFNNILFNQMSYPRNIFAINKSDIEEVIQLRRKIVMHIPN